ncbi:MAG: C10 family peptidase [Sphingobacteriaceae bacterium]
MKKSKIALFAITITVFFSCQKDSLRESFKNSITDEIGDNLIVNREEAEAAALNFSKTSASTNNDRRASMRSNLGTTTIDNFSEIKSNDKSLSIFVANYRNGGFALLSNNKNYTPILAFSETGSFDIEDPELNSGIKIWLSEIFEDVREKKNYINPTVYSNRSDWDRLIADSGQIEINYANDDFEQRYAAFNKRMGEIMASTGGVEAGVSVIPLSAAANFLPPERVSHFKAIAQQQQSPEQFTIITIINKDVTTNVEPLMNTNWYQGGVFAEEVPNDYAGCTAIAAGQIMNYYRYPNNFNWDYMTDVNLHTKNDISLFMKTLGQEFNMSYNSDGSGASNKSVRNALQGWGYIVEQEDHSYNRVQSELIHNRPVYLTGCRTDAFLGLIFKDCHAWVAEGIRKNQKANGFRIDWQRSNYTYATDGITYNESGNETAYFYVNWGWGTGYNGWFLNNLHNNKDAGNNYKYSKTNLYIRKGN